MEQPVAHETEAGACRLYRLQELSPVVSRESRQSRNGTGSGENHIDYMGAIVGLDFSMLSSQPAISLGL